MSEPTGLLVRVTSGPDAGAMVAVDRPVVVGREGDLALGDPTVSRRHLVLEPSGGPGPVSVTVRDAGSANGFAVDGRPGRSGAVLGPGDQLTVGRARLSILRLIRHHEARSGPHLLVEEPNGKVRAVALSGTTVVGRDAAADLEVDDPSVSRRHCTFRVQGDDVVVEDHSSNGTTVGGVAVRGSARVADGDRIRCGSAEVVLHLDVRRAAAPTAVQVVLEGTDRGELVVIDAAATATVAEVTLSLADALGCDAAELLLYRATDGVLLHPDDTWSSTGPRHGDELVLAPGDASAETPAPGRHWPRPAPPALNQLPRTVLPPSTVTIRPPDPPESLSWKGRGVMWQVIGGMGVVVMGVVMAIVRPEFALFGLMAGMIGLVAITASILGEQSRRKHRLAQHRARLADLDVQLATAVAEHDRTFRALSPDVDDLETWLRSASPRLWERRPADPDALRLRLGVGRRSFPIEIEGHLRETYPALREVLDRHRSVGPTPVLGPGPDTGSIGLVGDRSRATELMRRSVVEAALLHPPDQLSVWVLAQDDQWDWCRWLPHTAGGGLVSSSEDEARRLAQELAEQLTQGDDDSRLHLVVVPTVWDRTSLEGLVGRLVGHGLIQVFAEHQRALPNGIGTLLAIDPAGTGTTIGAYPDAPVGQVRVGRLSAHRAERLALALARASGSERSTTAEGIGDLLGLGPLATVDVASSWASGPPEALTVPIGVDGSGAPVTVGFRRDGPHGMIAGTTGSGKSELLQTLLGALALTHAPDRLTLFLIDYKGGATFAPLAPLPHVVGTVTDLENDSSLAERAFTALDAEIVRRKRALDAAGVPNLIEYEQHSASAAAPIPNLLVVIDEFALMVKSQPDLKERLDTVATQGRSLGIHLLLATQSPTGVITHAVRTNTNLWISLRVVSDSESMELLGNRAAARIPDGSPGRGFIRLGAGEHLRDFRAARIARPLPSRTASVRVSRPWGPPAERHEVSSTTELEVAVERIRGAWDVGGRPAPAALWLPPLTDDLPAGPLAEVPTDPGRLVAAVGLADRPAEQRQDPHLVDLSATGHLLVAGTRGYGKTTALIGVATDLAGRHGPDDLHVYGIDAGAGGLRPLEELPHTGGVVGAHDVERLTRLVDRIGRLVDRRRDALAATAAGDFLEWRASGSGEPWVLLLIDDLAAYRESVERIEAGRLADRLPSLLQNGPAVGVHVVLSVSQQTDLRMREASLVPERLLLRLTDAADYAMVDLRVRAGDAPRLPPGRAITNGPLHLQLAHASADDITSVAKRWASSPSEHRPLPVRRLPSTIHRGDLPPAAAPLVLGVGGPEVDAVGVDLRRGAPVLLVAGPIQSGRSTALLSALHAATEAEPGRRVAVVALRPGPLRDQAAAAAAVDLAASPAEVCDVLDRVLDGTTPAVVVLDDAEGLAGMPGVGERLERIVRGAAERDHFVLIGARLADLASIFEPWARYVTSLRRVVLLQPTTEEAFGLGLRLPPIPAPVGAGRGVLVDGSEVTALQLAVP